MGILLSPGRATSPQRLDLSARASDLPAELVQTAVDTEHRRRATNGVRRIFIVRPGVGEQLPLEVPAIDALEPQESTGI